MDWALFVQTLVALVIAFMALVFMRETTLKFRGDPEYVASRFSLSRHACRSMALFIAYQMTMAIAFVMMVVSETDHLYTYAMTASLVFLLLSTYTAVRALRDEPVVTSGEGGIR